MQLPFVLAIGAAEDLVNRALDLDPVTRMKLDALQGRSVLLRVDLPRVDVLVFLDAGRVQFTPLDESESFHSADAIVRATSFDYLRQLTRLQEPFQVGELQVEGDTILLQTLHGVARDLDIDWESALSRLVGDMAARQIGQGLRDLFGFARQAARDLFSNATTYLREQGQWFPYRWQVDDYIEEVQELRTDLERFEARVAAFERKLAAIEAARASGAGTVSPT